MHHRRFTLPALSGSAAVAIVALSAGAASAHVTVTPSTTAAGSYSVLTFSVGHGCEGSPTTRLTIAMPEDIPSVTPTVNARWDIEKVPEKLDEPIKDAHGNEVTERIAKVVYTAKTPLPDGYRDTVELQMQLPDAEGETLSFPVIQTCEKGETAWNETAAEGQDPEELERPAPVVTVTAVDDEGGHGKGEEKSGKRSGGKDKDRKDKDRKDAGKDGAKGARDADEDDDSNALAIGGLVAGVGGLALGGLAFARSGKKA